MKLTRDSTNLFGCLDHLPTVCSNTRRDGKTGQLAYGSASETVDGICTDLGIQGTSDCVEVSARLGLPSKPTVDHPAPHV